uniref:DDE-1 domain-containing protein n=1 Tax=Mycena chlorophos TaxID=658473 RepID=A0ABQ0LLC3_MYCCL|nr:predicted protein [Mycena chlorophos]
MVGRAQSSTKKVRKKREDVEWWMARAVKKYRVEQTRELGRGERRAGARAICTQVEEEYSQKFKKKIKNKTLQPLRLAHNTMLAQYHGRTSKSKSAESRGWLLVEEVEVVLKYLLECARRGFTLDHQRLKEVVDAICRARLEDAFPKGGDFEFDLPLVEETDGNGPEDSDSDSDTEDTDGDEGDEGEATSAGVAGPEDDEEMPGLAENSDDEEDKDTDDEEDEEDGDEEMPRDDEEMPRPERSGSSTPAPPTPILPENIYGADESGFMAAGSTAKRVIGPSKQNTQHKRTDGGRENITVSFKVDWVQEDPLQCSITYQEKGWTNAEIGLAFIENFHEQTKDRAAGHVRVLLVDGHNSHYGLDFLRFAREHRIHILCYPAHATHVYQGLDVVVFGALKTYWSDEKEKFRTETGLTIKKSNFLRIYARAHRRAFTECRISGLSR